MKLYHKVAESFIRKEWWLECHKVCFFYSNKFLKIRSDFYLDRDISLA